MSHHPSRLQNTRRRVKTGAQSSPHAPAKAHPLWPHATVMASLPQSALEAWWPVSCGRQSLQKAHDSLVIPHHTSALDGTWSAPSHASSPPCTPKTLANCPCSKPSHERSHHFLAKTWLTPEDTVLPKASNPFLTSLDPKVGSRPSAPHRCFQAMSLSPPKLIRKAHVSGFYHWGALRALVVYRLLGDSPLFLED